MAFLWPFSKRAGMCLKVDIMKFLSEFHAGGLFEESLNASFIALIPKILGALDLKDFRPINLVGCIKDFILKKNKTVRRP
jgi:hypothetical protein